MLLPVLVIAAATGGVGFANPTLAALADIPADYLAAYEQAGLAYDVPWEVIAAIGKVECNHGRNPDPACWKHGSVNQAGAGGPMQFLAETWTRYGVDGDEDGSADRWNPTDAIFAAANLLASNGAPDNIPGAVHAYNPNSAYVEQVLSWADLYRDDAPPLPILPGQTTTPPASVGAQSAPSDPAAIAVRFAIAQIGTPYRWGAEGPDSFDCSGLVQAAYDTAGIQLPRVAQQQYDAGPLLPRGAPLLPGDLAFFGSDTRNVGHVGIVVSPGEMVDAPYTGAFVRIDSYQRSSYLGASRPSAR